MGFELPNGKTARNIQEQVAFLTEKVKELFAAVSELGFKVVKVDVLPEEGASRTIYLVPSSDPETANSYDEYIWTDDGWEKIGSTDIDLSNYVDLTSAQTISGNKDFSGVVSFIGGANFNGPIKTTFYPETANSYDLGLSSYTWRNIYLSGMAYFGADKFIYLDSSNRLVFSNNADRMKIGADGIISFVANLNPLITNSYDLGSSSMTWKDGYFSGNVFASEFRGNYFGNSGTNAYMKGALFAPDTNGNKDLGRSTLRWKDFYLSGVISDGTNSATVADIAALITYAKAQGWIQ